MPQVGETLRDYARYFIGSDYAEGVTAGLFSLEKNTWGPLLSNELVQRTLQQWQDMEKIGAKSSVHHASKTG